jgi:outer membrane protein OmpA-like peptidoglycan-associated protein
MLYVISFSQETNNMLVKANNLYDKYAYIKSIEIYEKVAEKGYKSTELFEKLGDCYYFNSQYSDANKWYAELFKLELPVDPKYSYRYSQTLKSVGDSITANRYLQQFSKLSYSDTRAIQFRDNNNYLAEIKNNSSSYTIENAAVNTAFDDYGGAVYKDEVVFTSSRIPEEGKIKKDNWTGEYFSSLYAAKLSDNGTLSDIRFFAGEIQTKYHDSDPVFSKDGLTVYLTRNNYLNHKKKTSSNKAVMLKIYKATFKDGKWSDLVELPFNNDQYNCAHPAISPDEKTLYFVSDMPGGYGQSDIYKVSIDNNTYGVVMNLGNKINTQGKETFPFANNSNDLYFASDGHLGLGGLDLFVTNIEKGNYLSEIVNVGEPINSAYDDFNYMQNYNSKYGFFSSNRPGGKGKDDIYLFVKEKKIEFNTTVKGIVVNDITREGIANANVTIYGKDHKFKVNVKTDTAGRFFATLNVPKDELYYIKAEQVDYQTDELSINSIENDLTEIIIPLNELKSRVGKGSDLAKVLHIKNILFDVDKYNIRPDVEVEMQKVLQVMKDYPEMRITINSYTDSRQTYEYNMRLSQKRANSTLDYLISHGIAADRLTAKGYGETHLLNNCADGIKCSESEHQVNRRGEFIIDQI